MKNTIINRPTRAEELSFEDFYAEISEAWERRAKELQARRWAKIKQKQKEDPYHGRRGSA
jgi:hypothetical protein